MRDCNVPAPPPIGTIVRSHIALDGHIRKIYPAGRLFVLTDIRRFHAQGYRGYWSITVEEIHTRDRIETYDDYFKKKCKQEATMDIARKKCVFDD